MKVCGFVASPRHGGNTDILVQRVLDGAREEGAKTTVHYLNDLSFRCCQGCRYCKVNDSCRLHDDMQDLYRDLHDADGIVIGSPIYFGQMSGVAKCFLDRWFALMNPDFSSRLPAGKRGALVFPQGDTDPAVYAAVPGHFRDTMEFFGITVVDAFIAPGLLNLGDAAKDPLLMERSRRAGRLIVSGP